MRLSFAVLLILAVHRAASQCDTDNGWVESNGDCFRISRSAPETQYTWQEAREACMEEAGDLASIHSATEQAVLIQLAIDAGLVGFDLWHGMNQLEDKSGPFTWSDESATDYTFWATGQPLASGLTYCGFTETQETPSDFERHDYTSTVYGLLTPGYDYPQEADGIYTFYFGGGYQYDQEWCEYRCETNERCAAYTWYWYHWDYYWEYTCVGRTDFYNILEYDSYGYSGVRRIAGTEGWWFSTNCGLNKAFACRKEMDADGIITMPPTSLVPGYCPDGYFEADAHDSNKCFRIVEIESETVGFRWEQALYLCRAGPGIDPDLASIHSIEQNSKIAARLQSVTWGYWIGLHYATNHYIWVWADNTEPRYYNWGGGQPDGEDQCTELWTSPGPAGTWNNIRCDQRRGYICQTFKDPGNTVPTPEPTTPHTCDDGFTPYWYGCYRLDTTARTFDDAKANCESLGANLVSMHHEAENAAVFLGAEGDFPLWIGLFRNPDTNSYEWVDGWPSYFSNFDVNGTLGEGCVSMKSNSKWNDTACGNTYPSICKTTDVDTPTLPAPEDGFCQRGWVSFGGRCYYFSETSETWADARIECQIRGGSNYPAELASVSNEQENQFIYSNMYSRSYVYNFWIGLARVPGTIDEFYWTDGTPYTYSKWAPGEPNDYTEMCTELKTDDTFNTMWNDRQCGSYDYLYFVCESELGPSPTYPYVPTPNPGECPSIDWYKYGTSCFLIRPNTYTTWYTAADDCRILTGGRGTLTTIHSQEENDFIWFWADYLNTDDPYYSPHIWVGLSKNGYGYPFEWEDGTAISYTNWAPGEPNDSDGTSNCARMYISNIGIEMRGNWDDYGCSVTYENGYVCRTEQGYYGDLDIPEIPERKPVHRQPPPRRELLRKLNSTRGLPHRPHDFVAPRDEHEKKAIHRPVDKGLYNSIFNIADNYEEDKMAVDNSDDIDSPNRETHGNQILLIVLGCVAAVAGIAAVLGIVLVKKRVLVPQPPLVPNERVATIYPVESKENIEMQNV